jgi:hypothetical protein
MDSKYFCNLPSTLTGQAFVHEAVSDGVYQWWAHGCCRFDNAFLRTIAKQAQLTLNQSQLHEVCRAANSGSCHTKTLGHTKGDGTGNFSVNGAFQEYLPDYLICHRVRSVFSGIMPGILMGHGDPFVARRFQPTWTKSQVPISWSSWPFS